MGSMIFDLTTGSPSISRTWTYSDMNTTMSVDPANRDVLTNLDINAVQDGITNMFLFAPGERILYPTFGNSLYKYLYQPVNDLTAKQLGRAVVAMFEQWEPRVTITTVTVTPYPDQNVYDVAVTFSIPTLKATGLNFSLSINARR